MPTPLKQLEQQVEKLSQQVEKLSNKLESECEKLESSFIEKLTEKVHTQSIEQENHLYTLTETRIDSRFKSMWLVAGALISFLSIVGYFGIQSLVTKAVNDKVDNDTLQEIQQLKKQSQAAVADIEKARIATQSNPLIVLQTDYGAKSPYVGALMGAIYNVNPHARIQTITNEIDSFDTMHAAWVLWRSGRYFPEGTIFVVITNPGGLTSQLVVIRTKKNHIYIGFDNGCFDFVAQYEGHLRTYAISSPDLSPIRSKDLFGGIDVCGPTAAKLSLGFEFVKIGPSRDDYQPKLVRLEHRLDSTNHAITATITDIDGYGNITTNVTVEDLEACGIRMGEILNLSISNNSMTLPLRKTYGNVSQNDAVAIVQDDLLQFAINLGSFQKKFSVARGDTFEIKR